MSDNAHAQLKASKWALILGASSGFGEGAARALAAAGYDIVGVHLDRKAGLEHVAEIRRDIEKLGRKTQYFNINAADEEKRNEVLADRRLSFMRTIDRRIRVARDTTRRALSPPVAVRRLRAAMANADDAAALDTLIAAVEGFEPSEQAHAAAGRARQLRTTDITRAIRPRRPAA